MVEPLLLSLLVVVLGMTTGLPVYLGMALAAEAHQGRPRVAEGLTLSRCPSTLDLDDMVDAGGGYHLAFFQMPLAQWVRLELLQSQLLPPLRVHQMLIEFAMPGHRLFIIS